MLASFDFNKPYLCVPQLIEQPTWGGEYIIEQKGWKGDKRLLGKKFGQSYELYGETNLLLDNIDLSGEIVATVGWNGGEEVESINKDHAVVALADAIKMNPEAVLGTRSLAQYGNVMPLLLKFTQAKGNSFQLHVQPKYNGSWEPKPESWYYFEPGILTAGIREGNAIGEYRKACEKILDYIQKLSKRVKDGKLKVDKARVDAQAFIRDVDVYQFVNVLEAQTDELIDLSLGGVHHSWEEDDQKYPHGNILYEIQLDVEDLVSSIRCFDKGKIKDDGSIRPIHIEAYFNNLDIDPEHNRIEFLRRLPKVLNNGEEGKVVQLLSTNYYCMSKYVVNNHFENKYTNTDDSFHHLFVKLGKVDVQTVGGKVTVSAGHSCFIPAAAGSYSLDCGGKLSEVIVSYIN